MFYFYFILKVMITDKRMRVCSWIYKEIDIKNDVVSEIKDNWF